MLLQFLIIELLIASLNAQCSIESITPVVNANDLPKLPGEFETRIQATLFNNSRTVDIVLVYDSFENRAVLKVKESLLASSQTFLYNNDLVLSVDGDNLCTAQKISETQSQTFLGFLISPLDQSLTIKPPEQILHFNNDNFPTMFVEKTNVRGIPVNHYRSCQNWTINSMDTKYVIDYYFSDPSFTLPIQFDKSSVPIMATINGIIDSTNFFNEYNFYEFKPSILDKKKYFYEDVKFYCEGQTFLTMEDLPKLPTKFSYLEEVLINDKHVGYYLNMHYDSADMNALSYDIVYTGNSSYINKNTPVRVIHDFNSGVGYTIDQVNGNCYFFPLDSKSADFDGIIDNFIPEVVPFTGNIRLKNPYEMFRLDESYISGGNAVERGIVVDKYISNRTDFKTSLITEEPPYWIHEIFFMSLREAEIGTEGFVYNAPISVKITGPNGHPKYVNNIYQFDPANNQHGAYDISSCFKETSKSIYYAIKFDFPNEIATMNLYDNYQKLIERYFYDPILNSIDKAKFSRLRLIPIEMKTNKDNFVVYSGVTDSPPPIDHFTKREKYCMNKERAMSTKKGVSRFYCAQYCLDSMNNKTDSDFKCLGYDFCLTSPNTYTCYFYDYNDPLMALEPNNDCDHYSKSVENFDVLSKEEVYRVIENLVISQKFSFTAPLYLEASDNTINLIFTANYISQTAYDFGNQLNDNIQENTGQTSFFKKFQILFYGADFNVSVINKNSSYQIRYRQGISIDQCSLLCLEESTFSCESFSYESIRTECRWSSVPLNLNEMQYIAFNRDPNLFIKNSLVDYQEYPFQVIAEKEDKELSVLSPGACAYECTKESNFTCRSFSLCQAQNAQDPNTPVYKCLLSQNHNDNIYTDQKLNGSSLCTHYSRRTIDDFKSIPSTQLQAKPKSKFFNTTVQVCAQMCTYTDSFVCRSFDFFSDSNDCYLYDLSLKDKAYMNVETINNKYCTHYSREYLTENGISQKIDPKKQEEKSNIGAGAIFGVCICVLIGGILFGILTLFSYLKITEKKEILPVMSFINPSYFSNSSDKNETN